ncbi:MAG: methyl-accepting chemotaxis protein [Elusimicrobia bacterium]|nr:methyl-accepting chemotaxis protein [Elusimicrobiota bacterium]
MVKLTDKLKSLYVDPELQFRFVVTLVILLTAESIFVGRILLGLVFIAKNPYRPTLLWDLFMGLFWLLVVLVILNTVIGLFWSVRIARPLKQLDKGLKDLREGRLSTEIESEPKDALKGLVLSFNETMRNLKFILSRDHQLVREAIKDIEKSQSAKGKNLQKLLLNAQSKLSIVTAHFFKNG